MADSKIEYVFSDIGGRRLGIERRLFSYDLHVPERRNGQDRRMSMDRRSGKELRHRKDRRDGRDRRGHPDQSVGRDRTYGENLRVAKLAHVL